MVEISLYGSGEGPGWVTAPGYSTEGSTATQPCSRMARRPNQGAIWPIRELLDAKKQILKLRAELRRVEEERDILEGAAAYFARESD